ncbi:hypothetical protein FHU31_002038 [Mycolicibacterium fluoranthenivorans]|uniref:Uncharacterized protein n=1 Tax=Mycolicibacterium fluoranthenivorans TaxID=258505 RepID=A0A7X5ZCI7_9MYCO|nr:hypothetical protein [Mycolicibacterium fluoranthenivorans]
MVSSSSMFLRSSSRTSRLVSVRTPSGWSATNRTARALNSSSYIFGMMQTLLPSKERAHQTRVSAQFVQA